MRGLPSHDRYLIQQNPEVEAKLVAELDKAGLLLTPQRLTPRAMEYADLAHLTYLSWVCKAGSLPVHIAMSHIGGLTLVAHTVWHASTSPKGAMVCSTPAACRAFQLLR